MGLLNLLKKQLIFKCIHLIFSFLRDLGRSLGYPIYYILACWSLSGPSRCTYTHILTFAKDYVGTLWRQIKFKYSTSVYRRCYKFLFISIVFGDARPIMYLDCCNCWITPKFCL